MESSGVHYIIHIKQIRSSKRAGTTAICRPCKTTATGRPSKGLSRASQDQAAAVAASKMESLVSPHESEDYHRFLQEAAEDELFTCP